MTNPNSKNHDLIAYFSMEIALDPAMPTYSGGLGILAGDMLRAAADLGSPMVGVTLAHRKGYFRQVLDAGGNQTEQPEQWDPAGSMELMEPVGTLEIEGREVRVRAWRYLVRGCNGHTIPVYLLDTNLPENSPWDRTLTDNLYGGDIRYRFCQETVLGIGGVRMLRMLEHATIRGFHMNEGHSALLTLALLEEELAAQGKTEAGAEEIETVRQHCIFTTHTPVPAGHDNYPWEMVKSILGTEQRKLLDATGCCHENTLNMTYLALECSRYINGVAMRHGEVSRDMYPAYPVQSITNGVHAPTWTSKPFQKLFDEYIPDWRADNQYLRYTIGIPLELIRQAHLEAKRELLAEVKKRAGAELKEDVFTVGFARRATAYKRADLLFSNPDRLREIAETAGGMQIVFGGKAHPQDARGKALIHRIFEFKNYLKDAIQVVYVENYDWRWGRMMTAGVDLWLNTPLRPNEASGTSGMKAMLNGVPNLSVLDGWWIEGHVEGKTGWAIGQGGEADEGDEGTETAQSESKDLYEKLEQIILPMYYRKPRAYAAVMRYAVSLNASFFNTQRMVLQYIDHAYFPEPGPRLLP